MQQASKFALHLSFVRLKRKKLLIKVAVFFFLLLVHKVLRTLIIRL